MKPQGPAVVLVQQYAQALKTDYTQKPEGTQPGKVGLSHPAYHKTLGDENMANAFVRHGPDALFAYVMKKAFNPRELSIAKPDDEVYTRFPLPERPHERSENLNSPATVYSISEHPKFKPQNKQSGEKDKGDNPYTYKNYGKGYGASNVVVIYGQKTEKQKEKSIYSAGRNSQKAQGKKDYKVDFAANDNEKQESLYQTSVRVLSEIYTAAVKKAGKYLVLGGYGKKLSDQSYNSTGSAYAIVSSSVFVPIVGYSNQAIIGKPTINSGTSLEKRVELLAA